MLDARYYDWDITFNAVWLREFLNGRKYLLMSFTYILWR
jgi:hypothetical protein